MGYSPIQIAVCNVLAVVFLISGSLHLTHTKLYLAVMPPYIPFPQYMVWGSGVYLILAGIGLIFRISREFAGIALVLLMISFLTVHFHMAIYNVQIPGFPFSREVLWLRVPVQFVLIGLIDWASREHR